MTLGLAVVLTVIGVGSVLAGRVGNRTMGQAQDWSEAQALAYSAAEHAMLQIDRTSGWRIAYSGQTVEQSLGRGTFCWQLVSETGGDLSDNAADPFAIVASATVGQSGYTMRVHMTAPSNTIAAGVSVAGNVTLSSNASIDSFDSSRGLYGPSNRGSDAVVKTNAVADSAVSLSSNADINGSVQVGPDGDPDRVVHRGSNSTVSGTVTAMSQDMAMPTLVPPMGLGPSTGDVSYQSNQIVVVGGDLHVDSLSLKSNSRLRISGTVTILAEEDFSVSGNARIEILPNSSLTVYVKGSLSLASNANANLNGANLSSLKFFNLGTSQVTLSSNSTVQGVIVSPNAVVQLGSNAELFGAVVAKDLVLSSNAAVHEDKNITHQADRVTFPGGSSKPQPDAWSRVVR